jgi:peroxiredoxin Q/BCP
MALNAGDKAPGFSILDDQGAERSLAEFQNSTVILYFYPKDDTPG